LHVPVPFCFPCFSVSGFVVAMSGLGVWPSLILSVFLS
jgi:hypothetical protein